MTRHPSQPGSDGYFHPTTEDEIVELVRYAHSTRTRLRAVGCGHSERGSIFPGLKPRGAYGGGHPPTDATFIAMDAYRGVTFHDDGLVEVDAGCTFGKDPYDPARASSWSGSLASKLMERGLALPDLGAVSQHTVSGFLSTGSMGGSVQHSFADAVEKIRFVDGKGDLHEASRGDELFDAMGVSMGLYGVLSKLWLRPEPSYNVVGRELRKPIERTPVDFFGEDAQRIPFASYLREMPYSRAVWWPQDDFEHVALWEASRVESAPLFEPVPYRLLPPDTRLISLAANVLLTVLGNLDDLRAVRGKLAWFYEKLDEELDDEPDPSVRTPDVPRRHITMNEVIDAVRDVLRNAKPSRARAGSLEPFSRHLLNAARLGGAALGERAEHFWDDKISDGIVTMIRALVNESLPALGVLGVGKVAKLSLPYLIRSIVSMFVQDGDSRFQDDWFHGLAIDDQLDARLWPLRFMELAVPIDRAEDMMKRMRAYFRAGGNPKTAYERTGAFAFQVYGGKESPFWMSQAHGTDVVRFDAFWFHHNAGDPRDHFFRGIWETLEPLGFRPHWGKVLPSPGRAFASYYAEQLPRMNDFKRLRRGYDPADVFLTDYFREHLDI